MKNFLKTISVFMCICLVINSLPITALADEYNEDVESDILDIPVEDSTVDSETESIDNDDIADDDIADNDDIVDNNTDYDNIDDTFETSDGQDEETETATVPEQTIDDSINYPNFKELLTNFLNLVNELPDDLTYEAFQVIDVNSQNELNDKASDAWDAYYALDEIWDKEEIVLTSEEQEAFDKAYEKLESIANLLIGG